MKTRMLDILICPGCLPEERALTLEARERGLEGEVVDGDLLCPGCGARYPVLEGIALLVPDGGAAVERSAKAEARYESAAAVAAYLWSHYLDLLEETAEPTAYAAWGDMLTGTEGLFLDAGCAVGRLTFAMSGRFDFSVGVDLSYRFVKTARRLMHTRSITFDLPLEGRLCEQRAFHLPAEWNPERVEFLVADAARLPFRSDVFAGLASLNLVDKMPKPLDHLREMDRVARAAQAEWLFSDPFSWSTDVAKESDWLGGTESGRFAGRGLENVCALLRGDGQELRPWRIERPADVWWRIRNHENHFETIRSRTVKAKR